MPDSSALSVPEEAAMVQFDTSSHTSCCKHESVLDRSDHELLSSYVDSGAIGGLNVSITLDCTIACMCIDLLAVALGLHVKRAPQVLAQGTIPAVGSSCSTLLVVTAEWPQCLQIRIRHGVNSLA